MEKIVVLCEYVVDVYQPECSAYQQNQQAYLVEDDADWEFTDLMEISEDEYRRLKHREDVRQENHERKHKRLVELQYREMSNDT